MKLRLLRFKNLSDWSRVRFFQFLKIFLKLFWGDVHISFSLIFVKLCIEESKICWNRQLSGAKQSRMNSYFRTKFDESNFLDNLLKSESQFFISKTYSS